MGSKGGDCSTARANVNKDEVVNLLAGREMPDEDLFASARSTRSATFRDHVVVRAVVELTNECRVNCTFCPMRRDNTQENSTYILDENTVVMKSCEARALGINVVFIQGGEIPQTTGVLERAIPQIIEAFDGQVEILLNLGNKSRAEYGRLKKAGAYSYILKHETSDASLYEQMKFETLDQRLRCMHDLLDLGFKVGTGSIIGLPGQTLDHVAADILLAKRLGVHMISASPFVPAPRTPLERHPAGSVSLTLRAIAVGRLLMPEALIPSVSALEVQESGGQSGGLRAGANVVTVNFTPPERRSDYLIYGVNRYVVTLQHVRDILNANGLRMGGSWWVSTHKIPRAPTKRL
jgi:biotin synthase